MRAHFVDVDGISTRYLTAGSGPPLLLVHGFGVGAETWGRNIDALGESHLVIAPDQIGQGFTDPVDLDGGPPQGHMVQHLVKFVDVLGLEKFDVVGSSFGALIACLIYLEIPERVDRLVLVGSGSVFSTHEQVPEMVEAAFQNAIAMFENPTIDACRQRLADVIYDPASVPEEMLPVQMTSFALPGIAEYWKTGVRGMLDERAKDFRVYDRLEEIAVPTLIVWGREDRRGILDRMLEALPRFPDARHVVFEKCGHLPYIEHPELFNQTVVEYLA